MAAMLSSVEALVRNYQILIYKVLSLDEERRTDIAKQFFRAMASCELPFVEQFMDSFQQKWSRSRSFPFNQVKKVIDDIKNLRGKVGPLEENRREDDRSPLQLLLLLAVCQHSIQFNETEADKKWGRFSSFRQYLEDLRFRRLRVLEGYWPGLPACVLAHISTDSNVLRWPSVISTSADRYDDFYDEADRYNREGYQDIDLYSIASRYLRFIQSRRFDRIERLEQKCGEDIVSRVEQLSEISTHFKAWAPDCDTRGQDWSIRSYHLPQNLQGSVMQIPLKLPGILATWCPDGDYLPFCLLDRFRFRVDKPRFANGKERNKKDISRKTYPPNSCAEWSGLLEWCNFTRTWPTAYELTQWPPREDSIIRIPRWPSRAWDEMPFSPYRPETVACRPDRYDTVTGATELNAKWEEWFPGLPLRRSVANGTLFGQPVRSQYAHLANLEGKAVARCDLNLEEIIAGLEFSLQDIQDTVWISNRAWDLRKPWTYDESYKPEKLIIRDRRFHVWPVRRPSNTESNEYPVLAIYDRKQDAVHWFQCTSMELRQDRFARQYRKFLQSFDITIHTPKDVGVCVPAVQRLQSGNAKLSSFHLIENSRVFFREPVGQGLTARSWHESRSYKNCPSPSEKENEMLKQWIRFARVELGHADESHLRNSNS